MQKYSVDPDANGEAVIYRKNDAAGEFYFTADVDARIAELEGLLTECLNTNENEHMDPGLVDRINRSLMVGS